MELCYKGSCIDSKIIRKRFDNNLFSPVREIQSYKMSEMRYSYEEFVLFQGPRIINSIINNNCSVTDMVDFRMCCCYHNFNISVLPIDESFINGLLYILKTDESYLCKKCLHLIQILWKMEPNKFIIHELVDSVFCCFHYVDIGIQKRALHALCNYLITSDKHRINLIKNNIFEDLRNYFMKCKKHNEYSRGFRMLFLLINNKINEVWYQLIQIIPILQFTLSNPSPLIRRMTMWCLIPILENERGFQYCCILGFHNTLKTICTNVLNLEYGYAIFRCVYEFLQRGYTRVFSDINFINSFHGIIYLDTYENISPIFYCIGLLIPRNWEIFIRNDFYLRLIQYSENSSLENKLSSAFCIAQLIIYSHPQYKDIIGTNGGANVLCSLLECFNENELFNVLKSLLILLDLNFNLYHEIILKDDFYNRLIYLELKNTKLLDLRNSLINKLSVS